ncbi:MAG: TonB-dependent receptor plug domain-containing protein [Tannerellaceae bacterium]|nr:TonB-dependent receptor plug domain-containing protein [Tannerellaceae bacterium]
MKKALGYSVSSVKGDELTNAGTPMNAIQGLYGKTSGLQIAQTNAGPTGGMVIKVRNAVSMNDKSTTRPLIVVDGIPIHDENTSLGLDSADGADHGTGLNDINPEDIASIEILKGAKAAVLYRSEGANGVMLITTKSGSKKGLGIDFGVNYSWTKAAFMPKLQNEFGTGQSLGNAALNNISPDGYYMTTDPTSGQAVEVVWRGSNINYAFGPKLDGRRVLGFDDVYHDYVAYENNYKDMYRTGHLSNVNFALSNGGDLGSFRLSYNYRDYNSISIGADNRSHSFNFSGDLKANDWVKLRVNSSYSTSKDHNAPYQLEQLITYGVPRELDVNYIKNTYLTDEGYNRYGPDAEYVENYSAARRVSQYYWSQLQNSNDYQRDHFIQSINMDVTFNDKFSWTTLGGMDYTVSNQETKQMLKQSLQVKAAQGFY